MKQIDLNADLGEGSGNDHLLMPLITSANIACGGHAGDTDTLKRSIELAMEHNVSIGAHPGFEDKENFGRQRLQLSDQELTDQISNQLLLFSHIAAEFEAAPKYVKLHGAMANMAAEDESFAKKAFSIVKTALPNTPVLAIANSHQISAAKSIGIAYFTEAFADRAYTMEGQLAPRSQTGAMLHDKIAVLSQIKDLVQNQEIKAITGETIALKAQSICVHGDNEHALTLVKAIRNELEALGISVTPFIQH
jgi:UPF0271 protein